MNLPRPGSWVWLRTGDGWEHVRNLLPYMEAFAVQDATAPVVQRFSAPFRLLGDSDFGRAVRVGVRHAVRYVRDPMLGGVRARGVEGARVEFVAAPRLVLRSGVGDCDDMAALVASICECCGRGWDFEVSEGEGGPSHVWAVVRTATGWEAIDPVLPGVGRGERLAARSRRWYRGCRGVGG